MMRGSEPTGQRFAIAPSKAAKNRIYSYKA